MSETDNPFDKLTPRERDVAHDLCHGKRNDEIAERLGISRKTVDTFRHNAIQKVGVRNNVELAMAAVLHGFVTWPVLTDVERENPSGALVEAA